MNGSRAGRVMNGEDRIAGGRLDLAWRPTRSSQTLEFMSLYAGRYSNQWFSVTARRRPPTVDFEPAEDGTVALGWRASYAAIAGDENAPRAFELPDEAAILATEQQGAESAGTKSFFYNKFVTTVRPPTLMGTFLATAEQRPSRRPASGGRTATAGCTSRKPMGHQLAPTSTMRLGSLLALAPPPESGSMALGGSRTG